MQVPKLTSSLKARVNIVKCVGKHHKELLHEICDHFDAEQLEVISAGMDRPLLHYSTLEYT